MKSCRNYLVELFAAASASRIYLSHVNMKLCVTKKIRHDDGKNMRRKQMRCDNEKKKSLVSSSRAKASSLLGDAGEEIKVFSFQKIDSHSR